MVSIFKLLFFLFIAYILFNLFRFIFYLGRGVEEGRKRFSNIKREEANNESIKKNSDDSDRNIIELDKDQYKVE